MTVKKRLCREWVGVKVRTNREITRSDGIIYPEGTAWTVDGVWRGKFHLLRVGEKGYIRQVPRGWFDEVTP